ncbi:MAG: CDP-alcohol phosphatidyltransferase family protein [Syntrophorhabdales bacterium]|jgi:cardiolipin synthase
MNLPNLLSLFRLFVTAFFIALVAYGRFNVALFLFLLQALSDLLDGFFARRMGAKTSLGAYLDPLADKVMLASSYIVLSLQKFVPFSLVAVVLLRDLVISIGFLILLKRGLAMNPVPSLVSKATTVFQMVTVVYVLSFAGRGFELPLLNLFFFGTTALLTLVSGFQYVSLGLTAFFRKEIV